MSLIGRRVSYRWDGRVAVAWLADRPDVSEVRAPSFGAAYQALKAAVVEADRLRAVPGEDAA